MYAQKHRKQFSDLKTREMAQNKDGLFVENIRNIAQSRAECKWFSNVHWSFNCWENVQCIFVFVSLWMKCLQFPSGFLIAYDQFKTLCQTQIRGPYGPHLHVSPSPCQKCTCVFRIPWNGPLSLNLKCNFNC